MRSKTRKGQVCQHRSAAERGLFAFRDRQSASAYGVAIARTQERPRGNVSANKENLALAGGQGVRQSQPSTERSL